MGNMTWINRNPGSPCRAAVFEIGELNSSESLSHLESGRYLQWRRRGGCVRGDWSVGTRSGEFLLAAASIPGAARRLRRPCHGEAQIRRSLVSAPPSASSSVSWQGKAAGGEKRSEKVEQGSEPIYFSAGELFQRIVFFSAHQVDDNRSSLRLIPTFTSVFRRTSATDSRA